MNREQRRSLGKVNGRQAHAPQQIEIQMMPPHLAPLDEQESQGLMQHRAAWQSAKDAAEAEGRAFDAPIPPVPAELCIATFTILPTEMALVGLAPDGTAIMAFRVGIPGTLLRDMQKASRILDPNGQPTGAAAAFQAAMANVAPRVCLALRRSMLSDGALDVLEQKHEPVPSDVPPLPHLNRTQE